MGSQEIIELAAFAALAFVFYYGGMSLVAARMTRKVIGPPGASTYADSEKLVKLPFEKGRAFTSIHLPNEKARFTLLYCHGGDEDLNQVMPLLKRFQERGFAVFGWDYPGYGTSEGRATEGSMKAAVIRAYEFLVREMGVHAREIIAMGRDVGAGPAIELAARKNIAGLILESPITSSHQMWGGGPLLPFNAFDNVKAIAKARCPVLLLHGGRDAVVPASQAERLFKAAKEPKQLRIIANGSHEDLHDADPATYWSAIKHLAKDAEANPLA